MQLVWVPIQHLDRLTKFVTIFAHGEDKICSGISGVAATYRFQDACIVFFQIFCGVYVFGDDFSYKPRGKRTLREDILNKVSL